MRALLTTYATLRIFKPGGVILILGALAVLLLLAGQSLSISPSTRGGHAGIYAVVMFLELIIVGFGIAGTWGDLAKEHKSGWLEMNRLTGLRPWELLAGYAIGLRSRTLVILAMTIMTSAFIALAAGVPIAVWAVTQLLLLTSLISLTCVAAWAALVAAHGSAFSAVAVSIVIVLAAVIVPPDGAWVSVTHYLVPWHFVQQLIGSPSTEFVTAQVELFTFSIPRLALILIVQALAMVLAVIAATRRFAQPDLPATTPALLLIFGALALVIQHGLLWPHTQGQLFSPSSVATAVGTAHIKTLLLGTAGVAIVSLTPLKLRLAAAARGGRSMALLTRTGLVPAIALAAMGSLAMLAHVYDHWDETNRAIWICASLNLLLTFMFVVMVVEWAGVWFGSTYAVMAWIILVILLLAPLLADAFYDSGPLSPLATGASIIAHPAAPSHIRAITIGHAALVAVMFIIWLVSWRRLLKPSAASASPSASEAA